MDKVTSFWQQLYQQSQRVDLQHMPVEHIQLNHDLAQSASIDTGKASWLPSPAKGVARLLLEREGGEKTIRATSIVAYAANSQFAAHAHPKGEEFFVLAGTFSDQHGDYPADTYVRNPPGSSHQPFSREGGLIQANRHDIVMSAFACMYFQDPSFLAFQKRLESKLKSSNLKTLFDVKDIPQDTQLRTELDNIPTDSFSDVFTNMFEQLRRYHHISGCRSLALEN